ncbi:MAG: NUDIX domain-containing protein [Mycobacteriales bacterium]
MSEPHGYDVTASRRIYDGRLFGLRLDTVVMPGGASAERDVFEHPGAVVVAALDGAARLALVRQFRHPIGRYTWELPAGLCDVADEPLPSAAARELCEETGLEAATWDTLLDLVTSPGFSTEQVRVFLARDLRATDDTSYARHHEEAEMTVRWVPIDAAVAEAFAGTLENAATVAGVLAVARARGSNFRGLRPADARFTSS